MARWTDYQLSRLETIFAIIVLLIVLSAILNRAVVYFTLAERALVDNVVTNINAALRLTEAGYVASGRQSELPELAGANPVVLITERPADYQQKITEVPYHQALLDVSSDKPLPNYLGEMSDPQPSEYQRGSWYFDNEEQTLVYMVRNRELFRSQLDGPARIRFKIILDYRDKNGDGHYDRHVDEYLGIKLKPMDDYEWLI